MQANLRGKYFRKGLSGQQSSESSTTDEPWAHSSLEDEEEREFYSGFAQKNNSSESDSPRVPIEETASVQAIRSSLHRQPPNRHSFVQPVDQQRDIPFSAAHSKSQGPPQGMPQPGGPCSQSMPANLFPFLTTPKTYFKSQKSTRALDLFSGSGIVGNQISKYGFEVFSLDILQSANPTLCSDILTWDYTQFPKNYFRIIAAGVPCNEYSTAKTVGVRKLEYADKLVLRTLEIIQYFEPEIWWIENPRSGQLKSRDFMKHLFFVDVDYCQFSDWGYQKPTRIWCCKKMANLADKICDHKTCRNLVEAYGGGMRHREKLGGYNVKFGTRQKYRMPTTLVDYLLTPFEIEKNYEGWTILQRPKRGECQKKGRALWWGPLLCTYPLGC